MQRWKTIDRPASEQYTYWREVVCEAFTPLRPTARGTQDSWNGNGLDGWVDTHAFGSVNGAEIGTCEQMIHHGPDEVGRVSDEVIFVNLMLRGRSVVTQGGRRSMSGPGTFTIVDAARPFSLNYIDAWRAISFRLPAADVPGRLREEATARPFSAGRGLGAVLADTMRAAWAGATDLTAAQAVVTGTAIASLVGALSQMKQAEPAVEQSVRDAALRDSIEHYLARHLRYGDTSPATVARHFAISVRKLHHVYESAPLTFSQTVMRLRVQKCADDILAANDNPTLTYLSAKWGFSDLSHLNRAFRQHLGETPRAYAARRA